MNPPMIEISGVGKSFGAHEVLRGVDLSDREIGGRLPHRAERIGQEHAAPMRQLSRAL